MVMSISELRTQSILKGSCSGEFHDWDPNSEYCYLIKDGLSNWQDAQDYCSGLGGNLASINSQEEQDSLQLKVEELQLNPWIGLKAKGKIICMNSNSIKIHYFQCIIGFSIKINCTNIIIRCTIIKIIILI